jgi:hypothetical protein
MGSPLTFWKVQQAPVLWLLDRTGRGHLIDDPIAHQATLLPLVRLGCSWIWLVALLLTASWSRRLYGPRAMALAAAIFALSPNLLAHGALATMELPLLACTTGMFLLFWQFLRTGDPRPFWGAAALGGLAFSCKFTAVIVPPILGLAWWLDRRLAGSGVRAADAPGGFGMLGFLAVLALADLAVTGFARLPLSPRTGAHPSLDVGLGPALGRWAARGDRDADPPGLGRLRDPDAAPAPRGAELPVRPTRMHGWWYYYFVALAVKVPLSFGLLVAGPRGLAAPDHLGRARPAAAGGPGGLPGDHGAGLVAELRPALPAAAGAGGDRLGLGAGRGRRVGPADRLGWAWPARRWPVAAIHPHELSYFNALAGRPARRPAHPGRLEPRLGAGGAGPGPAPGRVAPSSGI